MHPFEVPAQEPVAPGEGLLGEEVGDQIEDGTVAHDETLLDRFIADCLGQMCFADAGRADEENIARFAYEMAGCQLVDILA